MARHDPAATPPERRRRPKGSIAARPCFSLSADDLAALQHLSRAWELNDALTVGRALREAAERAGWRPPSEKTDQVP